MVIIVINNLDIEQLIFKYIFFDPFVQNSKTII